MKRCFIFAAGSFYGLRERPVPGDLVIAADAGYLLCQRLAIAPDLVLGDFDSMPEPKGVPVRRVPAEKDDTDAMLALKTGLEAGRKEFYLYGFTGGKRLDHTLANLQSLLFLRRAGARGFLYGDDFVWTAIENEALTLRRGWNGGCSPPSAWGTRPGAWTRRGFSIPCGTRASRRPSPWGSATTSRSRRPPYRFERARCWWAGSWRGQNRDT